MTRESTAPKTDKRERILDAALSEFVERGYDGTSTALIAERAGVAKALVFHYFTSKDALFLAVSERVVERAQREFVTLLADAPPDLVSRMLLWTERKLALFREDSRVIRFFLFVLPTAPPAVRAQITEEHQKLAADYLPMLLEGADVSRLRVSPREALDALETLAMGFAQRLYALPVTSRSTAQIEKILKEASKISGLLASVLYREAPPKKGE
ncbi:MAG: TetR/AcrR family transcriptional regulator [Myxococcales bacterium]|nr:TetR/AcrR family transcriptional regulator [Myxococcales bacterium]